MENNALKTFLIILGVIVLGVILAYVLPKLGVSGRGVDSYGVYTLALAANGVQTNVGTVNLPVGTYLGGNPYIFILMTQDLTLLTEEDGWHYFPVGTKIDCQHDTGEPDPCDPYAE